MNINPKIRIFIMAATALLGTHLALTTTRASTITVNTTNNSSGLPTDCSLAGAIQAANTDTAVGGCAAGQASPVVDNIVFDIGGSGTLRTISLPSNLPEITSPIIIDGSTQAGASCTTPGGLAIELAGSGATFGIRVSGGGSGSTIKGLVIRNILGAGVDLRDGTSGTTVVCNYIGTDATGTSAMANTGGGVLINNSSNNLIGGTTIADRNLISGNGQNGIIITFNTGTSSGNRIFGNYIGTNAAGATAIKNQAFGVLVSGSNDTRIGDDIAGAGNLISGNNNGGIALINQSSSLSSGTIIKGNLIGLRAAGNAKLANGGVGILLTSAVNTQIGGTAVAARNVISGNAGGINIQNGSNGNILENNFVGTDTTGTVALNNTGNGIDVIDSSNNLIGGTTAASRNLVSGNGSVGISIADAGAGALGNRILGNFIGTEITGTAKLANASYGIVVAGADGTVIGDDIAGAGNLISGNGGIGIQIVDNGSPRITENCSIQNNFIGTNAAGNAAVSNPIGISVSRAMNTTIGGASALARNVISGNSAEGIRVLNGAAGALIEGNLIGLSGDGNGTLPNGAYGISIVDATTTGIRISRNAIWANGAIGIDLAVNAVNLNDLNDADTGPNGLQNFPVLNSAGSGVGSTLVAGTLNSLASRTYRLEFFVSPTADSSGYGQGRFYLGATDVTTNASNNASFSLNLPVGSIGGWFVTATATDLTTNETSEFSQARVLSGPTAASVTLAGRVTDPNGRPVGMAQVVLTDSAGITRRALTNPFGYYSFPPVAANETIVIAVGSKSYVFAPMVLTVTGDESNLDFVGVAADPNEEPSLTKRAP